MERYNNRIGSLLAIISLALFMLVGCNSNSSKVEKNTNKDVVTKKEDKLLMATFSIENKGDLILFDPSSKKETTLIKDRKVCITGDISNDGKEVAYVDALGDTDPWQIYLHNLGDKKTYQVTSNKAGKADAKFSHNNLIYFITLGSKGNGVGKVGKIDIKTKEANIIDDDNGDRDVDSFDIKDDNLVMSTCSRSLMLKGWEENNGNYISIPHTILVGDLNGNNLKEVGKFNALSVSSIAYSNDKSKVLISGEDINGDKSRGIYEVSIDSGKISPILTEKSMKSDIVGEFASPMLAEYSKDSNIIYFSGIEKGSKVVTIAELQAYPTTVYSYNIKTHEIKEIYKPKVVSGIFSIDVK